MKSSFSEPAYGSKKVPAMVAGIYATQFWAVGFFIPFFPIVLTDRGMSEFQIGVLLAIPMAVRIVCVPLISAFADRTGERRKTLLLTTCLAALFFTTIIFANSFWTLFFTLFVAASFWTTLMSLSDAYAGDVVRTVGAEYGRMRLWGSISFIVATLVGGYALQTIDNSFVIIGAVLSLTMMAAICLRLPDIGVKPESQLSDESDSVLKESDAKKWNLMSWNFLIPLTVTGAIQASHGVYYSFSSIHWQQLGISGIGIGSLWVVGVVVEVGLFWIAGRLAMRINSTGFIFLGGMAALARWLAFPYIDWFPGILLFQCLHGISFGATHMGMINLIREMIPPKLTGSAQGANSTILGILIATTTFFSGALFAMGVDVAFLSMAAIVAISLLLLGIHQYVGKFDNHPQSRL